MLVNGSPSGEFRLEPGLKQGDPLSLFLFLVVAEGFSRLMHRAVEMGDSKVAQIGHDKIEVSHLQFANDMILLGNANPENPRVM